MKKVLLSCGVLLSMLFLAAAQNGLTEADKQELLDAHNNLRSMVSPPARNMLRMVCGWIYLVLFHIIIFVSL